ncbi:response regulator transcription factor [Bacillaceae bacterium C204]|uniref:response regulator transcription factor n=1 Tax=Neobacillus sp. 204 TaxID=3383351 RepID=UPI00397AFA55
MWKMLIADDEPKIRRGLARLIDHLEIEVEVVGLAEDGEMALEMVKEHSPQLMLVDICMPFLNGLELIQEVQNINPDCFVVVITGYDEFTYAQKAVKLGVFDYLLKPIVQEQLQSVLHKAIEQLTLRTTQKKYSEWTNEQLKKNLPLLRERFLDEWMNGSISKSDIQEQMDYLNITLSEGNQGIMVIKLAEQSHLPGADKTWERKLALFALQNVITDLLKSWQPCLVFRDRKDYIVAILPNKSWSEWVELPKMISEKVESILEFPIVVEAKESVGGLTGICGAYEELVRVIENEQFNSPIVALTKKYIDTHFHKIDLSLQEVSDAIGISPAYLSRLLRQDLGASFIDYLSQKRIQHAIKLLNDPTVKIYEVAEKVGYKGQHYFSTVFKKVLGLSPLEYRKGGKGH